MEIVIAKSGGPGAVEIAEPISPAARRAIERALSLLRPYGDEATVSGLIGKLQSSIETGGPAERLAKTLVELDDVVRKSEMDGAERRVALSKSQGAQLEYLRSVSPAAAEAWEASRRRAGLR